MGVRLAQIPLKVRLRAASTAARANVADPNLEPADLLFARLMANVEAEGDVADPEVLRKVAQNPSDRLYWISLKAWERVMGGA